ncbi:AAA family ATPase [Egicoccus halophilus]|uniref:AAA+ ATPase domain-containing protein n=1 Tax=Egicoccus halophilus TaxID=1670830 RepID=A0A8J3AGB5_9ACTN|nr:AAA family ATPase [Egicoccus halophilus]GGI08737.1 hypothetical protein GCM10011354_30580 [Egicoccus halophilus]
MTDQRNLASSRVDGGGPVYGYMSRLISDVLIGTGSLLTPGEQIWTPDVVDDFYAHFVGARDPETGTFLEKMNIQLSDASAAARQLAAELLVLYYLPCHPSGVSAASKADRVLTALHWSSPDAALPEDVRAVFEGGLWHPGTWYLTRADLQVSYLAEFTREFKRLQGEQQQRLLDDPWELKDFVFGLKPHHAPSTHHGLIHLFHPDVFEPIIAAQAKQKIAVRFAELVTEPTHDLDRQLKQIRVGLTPIHSAGFHFYDDDVKQKWQPDTSKWGTAIGWAKRWYAQPDFDTQERDYKLDVNRQIDALDASDPEAFTNGVAAALRNNLVNYRVSSDLAELMRADPVTATREITSVRSRRDDAAAYETAVKWLEQAQTTGSGSFANLLSVLILNESHPPFRPTPITKFAALVGVSAPDSQAGATARYLAALDLFDTFIFEAEARGLELRDRLDAQSLIWTLASTEPPADWPESDRVAFLRWRGGAVEEGESDEETDLSNGVGVASLDDRLRELSERYHLGSKFLPQVFRLLEKRRQVIFQGPPGTGKTFIARKLAESIAGTEGDVRLVQFHASYAYEDFVQGYRPTEEGTFVLRDGPLVELARKARQSENATFVLIIDELNRANVAKVLGELYFLLEYRGESARMQYTGTPFTLPENLYVIGTMNTADRSIALLDSALRRRFWFVEFAPDVTPVKGLLARYLADEHPALTWLADVVDRANQLLDDRDGAIGPSHFLQPDLTEELARLTWTHAVLPHVQERLFDQSERIRDFDFEALRASVTASTPDPEPPPVTAGNGEAADLVDGAPVDG